MRWASTRIIAGVLPAFLFSSCGQMAINRLDIVNQSGSLLTNVYATFPGRKVAVNDIEKGKSIAIESSASRDGVIVLEYTQNGRQQRHEVTYVAPPTITDCHVILLENDIKRNCRTR